jgi:hypothetical protein
MGFNKTGSGQTLREPNIENQVFFCVCVLFRGWLVGWLVVGQDLHHTMFLPTAYREQLRSALEADTQFLALHNIMDYSLLLGIVVRTSHAHCLSIFYIASVCLSVCLSVCPEPVLANHRF